MTRRTPRSTRTYTLFPYTTLFRSNQRSGEPDEQVWPVRAEPPDEDAGDQDAAVRNEVVEAEGRCRTKVDVGILNALKQLQAGIVHHRRDRRHDHHRSADRFATLKVAPPRPEERRVGKECVSTSRSRGSPYL